uniref:Enoyl reductase (ER) domain-containing protein n=1 Tax=Skeletonema marinoi TaxID=267567 RepID=A0A7S2KS90_9STRA|mmetsp:Transcript_16249/g.27444  ORF Transcript_16249/g.27444 Transcript_16249/m.27444 type:complete len:360 (+) Transcript_16249:82-1161(+)
MGKPSIPDHADGETMKAVCFTSFGKTTDALSVETIPKPSVDSPDEVLIKVHACALNPIDKLRMSGDLSLINPEAYDTSVLGYDVAGKVVQVGEEVSKEYSVGDEVYVRLAGMKYGAMAEYVVCTTPEMAKKPKNISFAEVASIPLVGLTALQALRTGGVKEGSKVFIPGGAGGVGSIAIQIAKKMLKASHVTTTASPGAGTDICNKVGADRIIDYRSEDVVKVLAGEDFDMAFDTMNQAAEFGGLIKNGGKIVSISGTPTIEAIESASKFGSPSLLVRAFMFMSRNRAAENNAKKAGATWEYIFMKPDGNDLAEIAKYVESGDIVPIIDTEASSLDEFAVAADKLFSGRAKGKCVIKVA